MVVFIEMRFFLILTKQHYGKAIFSIAEGKGGVSKRVSTQCRIRTRSRLSFGCARRKGCHTYLVMRGQAVVINLYRCPCIKKTRKGEK